MTKEASLNQIGRMSAIESTFRMNRAFQDLGVAESWNRLVLFGALERVREHLRRNVKHIEVLFDSYGPPMVLK